MANDYFNHENPLTRHTLGRAEQVNATFFAIQEAFDKLPTPDQINRGSVAYVTDIGTVNSYVVNFARVPESYTEGMNFTMKAATTNTGASVINVNGLGAKQIRRYDGSPLQAGDIRAGQLVLMGYDGTRFLIVGVHGAEVAKARQWATSTSAVESGLLGARGYAQKADSWANANEDVVVEGGRYSAKHWALKAMSNAGLLPDENLDIPSRSYRDLGTAAEKFRDGNFSRNVSAAAFVGSGAGLTNLNASNISSGTLPNARLSGDYSFGSLTLSGNLSASGSVTALGSGGAHYGDGTVITIAPGSGNSTGRTIKLRPRGSGTSNGEASIDSDGNLSVSGTISGNGSGLTNLNASNISSGTLPAARLPNHSAALLTSGTLPSGRLSGNYSFGSLTLSGDISVSGTATINSLYLATGGNVNTIRSNGAYLDFSPDGDNERAISRFFRASPTGLHYQVSFHDGTSVPWLKFSSTDGVELSTGSFSGNGSGLTNLNGSNISSGTVAAARIADLPASKITSGTFNINRIPNIPADKLPSTVATVSTTGSASATNFPIGHVLTASGPGGGLTRRSSHNISLTSGDNRRYSVGSSGASLSGTWRYCGYAGDGNCVFQRVA